MPVPAAWTKLWAVIKEWAKQIFGIALVLMAVTPFLWWGRIWMSHATKARGRMWTIMMLLTIALLVFLFLVVWPRQFRMQAE